MKEFEDIEQELRKLRPVPPAEGLQVRIEKSLGADADKDTNKQPGRIGSPVITLRWAIPLGLAAALAIAAFVSLPKNTPVAEPKETTVLNRDHSAPVEPSAPARFVPVKARHVLMNAQEEGIFYIDDHIPARRMRYRFVDSYTWENSSDGSSLRVALPREEVLLIRLDTY